MFSVELDNSYKLNIESFTEGSQVKYRKDDYWYKEDCLGDEGLVEHLVSVLLKRSSIPSSDFVYYEQGIINGKNGCRSKSFLKSIDEEFITFSRLHANIKGKDLTKVISSIDLVEDRIAYVVKFFQDYLGFNIEDYLRKILSLDYLTLNTDRHFHNLGICMRNGKVSEAPIFDNGLSLLNGNVSINRHMKLEDAVKRIVARPFCGDNKRIVDLLGIGLKVDYVKLLYMLQLLDDSYYKQVLLYQLKRHRSLFSDLSITALKYRDTILGYRVKSLGREYDIRYTEEIVCNNILNVSLIHEDYLTQDEIDNTKRVLEVDLSTEYLDVLFN